MINAFYGTKIGQSQTFTEDGTRIPVTEILAEPLTVVQVKTADKDGYVALKVAFGERKAKNIKKPVLGALRKIPVIASEAKQSSKEKDNINEIAASVPTALPRNDKEIYPRYLREIRVKTNEDLKDIKPGDKINIADIFKEGDVLNVSGISIGKGFMGVVRRHHFKGGPRTHGQSDRERAPGSIGMTTTPGRVFKGKRMAGKMGGKQATMKNLKIVKIDAARNVVLVKGLVPGKRRGILKLYK